jgi:glycine/D-amino acid oxidase-like deaminating enzyme
MSSNPALISKDTSILIVGAGVFGLSTTLDLSIKGYKNITVIDRAAVPSPYSAGHDLNKIVRAEYEDPFYTELALVHISSSIPILIFEQSADSIVLW